MALYTFQVQLGCPPHSGILALFYIVLLCNFVLNSPRLGGDALTQKLLVLSGDNNDPLFVAAYNNIIRIHPGALNSLFKGFC